MPELPEVETVKRGLNKLLLGHKILSVDYDWQKSFPNSESDVKAFLVGSKIIDVRRRAKVLKIDLDTGYSLVIHLKMTGQLVYRGDENFGAGHPSDSLISELPDNSTRVIFNLSDLETTKEYTTDSKKVSGLEIDTRKKRSAHQDVQEVRRESTGVFDKVAAQERWQSFGLGPKVGQSAPKLFFNDQRKFGWVKLIPTTELKNMPFFQKVGPEPLDKNFNYKKFIQRLSRRKNSCIKAVLLDQSVIAGVGNIYADESLWGAKIHPSTLVKDIDETKLKTLFKGLKYVLELSIEKGGSTDKNYVDAEGKKGSYMDFARVFRRENLPCPRCKTIIEKTRVASRGTHFCPKCQQFNKK